MRDLSVHDFYHVRFQAIRDVEESRLYLALDSLSLVTGQLGEGLEVHVAVSLLLDVFRQNFLVRCPCHNELLLSLLKFLTSFFQLTYEPLVVVWAGKVIDIKDDALLAEG